MGAVDCIWCPKVQWLDAEPIGNEAKSPRRPATPSPIFADEETETEHWIFPTKTNYFFLLRSGIK
jgi:hypothetical protein